MKEYTLKRPMLLCAIMCAVISVIGYYSRAAVAALGIFYAIILGILILKKTKPQMLFILILVFIMLVSTVLSSGKAEKLSKLNGMKYTAEAVICEVTYRSEDYNCAVVQILDRNIAANRAKVFCFYEPEEFNMGQAIKAEFKFKKLENSIHKASNYSENIFLTANIGNITLIEAKNDLILTSVGDVRNYIKKTLFSNVSYNEASTLCALVFGDRSYFTDKFYSNVNSAGVSHVMVVSGMHLSVLVLFFLKITEKLFYNRYVRAIITVLVVIMLTALCGFTMSMLRAGLTYILVAFAIILKKDNTPANTLGAAAVIILNLTPFAVFSVAFQLSILSTFGILAVAMPVIEYSKSRALIKSSILSKIFSAVIITLSATLLTLPVTIYVFGYISTVAVITNILISYTVTLALSITVSALIVNLIFPLLAKLLFTFCEIIVKYINAVINFFGKLPFSVVFIPRWTVILSIILIIIIFYALLACKKRIDMIKLNEVREKIKKEGGKRLKWQ